MHDTERWSFWGKGAALLALLLVATVAAQARREVNDRGARLPGEWPVYGRDTWNTKYSPLAQLDRTNVAKLRVAWRWNSIDGPVIERMAHLKPGPNEFVHVVVVCDGTTLKAYVNALLADTDPQLTQSLVDSDTELAIGDHAGGGGDGANAFKGAIDEVAIYDKALALPRIQAHYAKGRGF